MALDFGKKGFTCQLDRSRKRFLDGLWHDVSANFILWEMYYGILLVVEKLLSLLLPNLGLLCIAAIGSMSWCGTGQFVGEDKFVSYNLDSTLKE